MLPALEVTDRHRVSYCPFKDSRVLRPSAISGPRVPPPSFYLLRICGSVVSGTHFQGLDSMLIVLCFILAVHNREGNRDGGLFLLHTRETDDLGLARGDYAPSLLFHHL